MSRPRQEEVAESAFCTSKIVLASQKSPRKRAGTSVATYNVFELFQPITDVIGLPPTTKKRRKSKPQKDLQEKGVSGPLNTSINQTIGTHVVKTKKSDKPRWWNQTYLLYLVLRKATRPLGRKDLITEALALDEEISKERKLPKLFGGKVFILSTGMGARPKKLTYGVDPSKHGITNSD